MRRCIALLLALLPACLASNGNGHDKLERDSPEPSALTSGTSDAASWWCIEVTGPLREAESREKCVRTRASCESMRDKARTQFGLTPSECRPTREAICFPVEIKDTGQELEMCFITGTECERVWHALMPGAQYVGCTIQTNDQP